MNKTRLKEFFKNIVFPYALGFVVGIIIVLGIVAFVNILSENLTNEVVAVCGCNCGGR